MFFKGFQFQMASSLTWSILIDPGKMSKLRYLTSVASKVHLESLRMRCSSQRCWGFFEGVREFPFPFSCLLGDVGGNGHFLNAQRDGYVFDLLKIELFEFFIWVHFKIADQVLLVDGVG